MTFITYHILHILNYPDSYFGSHIYLCFFHFWGIKYTFWWPSGVPIQNCIQNFGSSLQTPQESSHTNFWLHFFFKVLNILFFAKIFVLIGWFDVPIIFFRILVSPCKFIGWPSYELLDLFQFWGTKYSFLVAFRSPHAKLIESLLADTRHIFFIVFNWN
jgi:hypothetical protein